MKPVPRANKDDEDSITELKKQNEKDGEEAEATEEVAVAVPKENGYLTVLKNVPFLCVMLANLPAVMGLYIPYVFLPGVSALSLSLCSNCSNKEQRGRHGKSLSLSKIASSL